MYGVSNSYISNILTGKYVMPKDKILRPATGRRDKYQILTLCKNGKMKCFKIHRLVADAFVPNPKNMVCVNHIDCDRSNNHYTNLEWVSYSDNVSLIKTKKSTPFLEYISSLSSK
jgi:hypothetical protein